MWIYQIKAKWQATCYSGYIIIVYHWSYLILIVQGNSIKAGQKMLIYPRKFIITKCSTKLQRTKSAKARSGAKSCNLRNTPIRRMGKGERCGLTTLRMLSTYGEEEQLEKKTVEFKLRQLGHQTKVQESVSTLNSLFSLFTWIRRQTAKEVASFRVNLLICNMHSHPTKKKTRNSPYQQGLLFQCMRVFPREKS